MAPFPLGTTSYDRVQPALLRAFGGSGVDLHYHTRFSDGNATVAEVVDRAVKTGVGLAITDHNEVRASLEASRLAEGKAVLIPGIEVNCWEGRDLLVYFGTQRDLVRFYEAEIAPFRGYNPCGRIHRTLEQVAEGAHAFGGFVSAAHPFGVLGRKNLHRWVESHPQTTLVAHLDAVETNNGATPRSTNQKARAWARETGKHATGGSDGHTLYELGRILTWSSATTASDFFSALSSGETVVMGKKFGPIGRLGPAVMITRRHLLYLVPGVRKLARRLDPRAYLATTAIADSHPEYAREYAQEYVRVETK